ncbi:MAG: amidohydrolase family protein, partial [Planctomycetota bacterium]
KLRPNHTNVTEKLQRMDACGIDITMLSTNDPGPEWFGEQGPEVARVIHDFLAQTAKRHPGRFHGLIVLPYQDRRAAEAELERCVAELDMRGILLYSNLAGRWPDEGPFRWVFKRAVELDIPILLHPAKPMTTDQVKGYNLTSTLGNMFENTIALCRIIMSGILDQHPDLKLVCPHLGGTLPYISGRLDHQVSVLKRSSQDLKQIPSDYIRNVYLDLVSPLPLAMKFAHEFSGPDRLLFSSDHPWVDPEVILDDFRSLGLSARDQAKILGQNARKLFKL